MARPMGAAPALVHHRGWTRMACLKTAMKHVPLIHVDPWFKPVCECAARRME